MLVDSNILIDIATADPEWADWSAEALATAGQEPRLVINPTIHAGVSVIHSRIETVEALLPGPMFDREPLPRPAAFLAGKAFLAYRRAAKRMISGEVLNRRYGLRWSCRAGEEQVR